MLHSNIRSLVRTTSPDSGTLLLLEPILPFHKTPELIIKDRCNNAMRCLPVETTSHSVPRATLQFRENSSVPKLQLIIRYKCKHVLQCPSQAGFAEDISLTLPQTSHTHFKNLLQQPAHLLELCHQTQT